MSVQVIEQALGHHAELVTIEQAIDCIIIKQKEYIPKPTWDLMHGKLKQLQAKYVPAQNHGGVREDSHWEVPLLQPMKLTAKGHIAIIEGELEWLKKFLTEEMK